MQTCETRRAPSKGHCELFRGARCCGNWRVGTARRRRVLRSVYACPPSTWACPSEQHMRAFQPKTCAMTTPSRDNQMAASTWTSGHGGGMLHCPAALPTGALGTVQSTNGGLFLAVEWGRTWMVHHLSPDKVVPKTELRAETSASQFAERPVFTFLIWLATRCRWCASPGHCPGQQGIRDTQSTGDDRNGRNQPAETYSSLKDQPARLLPAVCNERWVARCATT